MPRHSPAHTRCGEKRNPEWLTRTVDIFADMVKLVPKWETQIPSRMSTKDPLSAREVRTQILEIARRRQKPGRGSSLQFLRQRTAMKHWPDLTSVLGEVPWATVGGVATRHYSPERATVDLDVLVERSAAPTVRERLRKGGFRYGGELTVGRSTWTSPDGIAVDVLESEAPWAGDALRQARQNQDLQGLPVLPLPNFILMKLQSGRTLDLADVTRMLGLASDADLNAVRHAVRQYDPDALEDLESMIVLGRMEMQP
jgi:hypothetical protein